jgi:hypothetical protein
MRLPNPWILIPTALAAVGGAVVGYFVTDASCSPESCVPLASGVAVIAAALTAAGVAVVIGLALQSLSEWRDHADRRITTRVEEEEPQGPPTC